MYYFFYFFFIPRPSTGAARGEPQASDRFFAIRFKLCTFIISIIFSLERPVLTI
jgi:hypothetical protein